MTAIERKQQDSPALTQALAADYPLRFGGRVPKTVRLLDCVCPDWPMPMEGLVGLAGSEFPVWVNCHGAVAIIFGDGRCLGVKPDEFEVKEWH